MKKAKLFIIYYEKWEENIAIQLQTFTKETFVRIFLFDFFYKVRLLQLQGLPYPLPIIHYLGKPLAQK